jgi:phage-related protein
MAETFSFDVRVGASGDVTQKTWENEFGDGYVQAGGIGINTKSESWSISVTGKMKPGEVLQNVRDFLDRQEGYKSFVWTPPGGTQGKYRANGYQLATIGAGLQTLSATFRQVFNP